MSSQGLTSIDTKELIGMLNLSHPKYINRYESLETIARSLGLVSSGTEKNFNLEFLYSLYNIREESGKTSFRDFSQVKTALNMMKGYIKSFFASLNFGEPVDELLLCSALAMGNFFAVEQFRETFIWKFPNNDQEAQIVSRSLTLWG